MSERRIFIATKKQHSVGVNFDATNNKAEKFEYEYKHEGEMQGFADTRMSSMSALIHVIENTDVSELTNVVPVFVNETLYKFITDETYKFWVKTGAKSTGEAIDKAELELISKFVEIWKDKGDDFVIRNIFSCRIGDEIKKDTARLAKFKLYTRQNDAYCRFCWDEIAKLYNESVENSIASVKV